MRRLPKNSILPNIYHLTVAKDPMKLFLELGQSLPAKGIYGGDMIILLFIVKTSEPQDREIFALNHLTKPGWLGIDHIPEQFSSHYHILSFQVSNLQSSLHPRHFDFLPADQSELFPSTIFPSLPEEGSQQSFNCCNRFRRS